MIVPIVVDGAAVVAADVGTMVVAAAVDADAAAIVVVVAADVVDAAEMAGETGKPQR